MPYVQVADPNLDVDKPIRSVDIKQIRDNQDYFDGLLETFLQDSDARRVFSHFNRFFFGKAGSNLNFGSIVDGDTGLDPWALIDGFWFHVENSTADEAEWRFWSPYDTSNLDHFVTGGKSNGAGGKAVRLYNTLGINFNEMTRPIEFKIRCQLATNLGTFQLGLRNWEHANIGPPVRPTDGIFLEFISAGNWQFVAANGSAYSVSAPFAAIAAATWFEVQILFQDDPANQAECYLNGALKHTFSAADNIPVGKTLFGCIDEDSTVANSLKLDRFEVNAAGMADAL